MVAGSHIAIAQPAGNCHLTMAVRAGTRQRPPPLKASAMLGPDNPVQLVSHLGADWNEKDAITQERLLLVQRAGPGAGHSNHMDDWHWATWMVEAVSRCWAACQQATPRRCGQGCIMACKADEPAASMQQAVNAVGWR